MAMSLRSIWRETMWVSTDAAARINWQESRRRFESGSSVSITSFWFWSCFWSLKKFSRYQVSWNVTISWDPNKKMLCLSFVSLYLDLLKLLKGKTTAFDDESFIIFSTLSLNHMNIFIACSSGIFQKKLFLLYWFLVGFWPQTSSIPWWNLNPQEVHCRKPNSCFIRWTGFFRLTWFQWAALILTLSSGSITVN